MPIQRNNVSFAFYAAASTLCAVSTVAYALHTRQQFYPTVRMRPLLHAAAAASTTALPFLHRASCLAMLSTAV